MITSIQVVQEALKNYYLPGITYQLNVATPLLAELEKTSENVVGGEIHMALRFGRHGGTGNIADDGDLPVPRPRQTKQAIFETKNYSTRFQITDKTIRASRSRDGAFIDLLEAEIDDAIQDGRDNINRQLFGDGTGKIATITSKAWSGGVLTVGVDRIEPFGEGQLLDIFDVSTGGVLANGGLLEVLSVDDLAGTLKLKAPTDISSSIQAGTDYLVNQNSAGKEITGLAAIMASDTLLYGIDRTVHKWLNPTVISVNGEISENGLQRGIHAVQSRAGGNIDFFVASLGVSRAYGDLLIARSHLVNPGNVRLEGGYEVVTFRGVPFTEDRYMPKNTLYGLQRENLKIYQLDPPDWLDRDGAMLSRLENKPVWQATLMWYLDLGCSKPRGNVVYTGITEH